MITTPHREVLLRSADIESSLVANAVIKISRAEDIMLTTSRLQALLFELELRHRIDTQEGLIAEAFLVHPTGPRLVSLDERWGIDPSLADVQDDAIDDYLRNDAGQAVAHYDLGVTGRIYHVLDQTLHQKTAVLSEAQRAVGGPWFTATQRRQRTISPQLIAQYASRRR